MLRGSSYKADFSIHWDISAKDIFFTLADDFDAVLDGNTPFIAYGADLESLVDVKSPFKGKNCSDATFSLNRKIVFQKYGIFVNKAILMPNKKIKKPGEYIFARTFTPTRYRFTNKTLQSRSIKNWEVIDLKEFLHRKTYLYGN
jgi:hypothetical protein